MAFDIPVSLTFAQQADSFDEALARFRVQAVQDLEKIKAAQAAAAASMDKGIIRQTNEMVRAFQRGMTGAQRAALELARLESTTASTVEEQELLTKAIADQNTKMEYMGRKEYINQGKGMRDLLAEQTDALIDQLKQMKSAEGASLSYAEQVAYLNAQMASLAFSTNDADKESEQYKMQVASLEAALTSLSGATDDNTKETKQQTQATEEQAEATDDAKKEQVSLDQALEAGGKVVAGFTAAVVAAGVGIVSLVASAGDWNDELEAIGENLDKEGTARLREYESSLNSVTSVGKMLGVQMADMVGPAVKQVSTYVVAGGLAFIDFWKDMQRGEGVIGNLSQYLSEVLVDALTLPFEALFKLGETFRELPSPVRSALNAVLPLTGALEAAGAASSMFGKSLDAWKEEQVGGVKAALASLARDGVGALEAATSDYMEEAERLMARQTVADAAERNKEAVQGQTKALEEWTKMLEEAQLEVVDPYVAATWRMHDAEAAVLAQAKLVGASKGQQAIVLAAVRKEYDDTIATLAEKEAADYRESAAVKATVAAYEEQIAKSKEVKNEWVGIKDSVGEVESAFGGLTTAVGTLVSTWATDTGAAFTETSTQLEATRKELEEASTQVEKDRLEAQLKGLEKQQQEEAKAATRAFRLSQAAAISGIVFDTAKAIMQAFAMFGPPPSPLGIAGAAAATIAGGIQAGLVLKEKPPTAVSDGVVTSGSGSMISTAPGDTVQAYQTGGVNDPAVIGRQGNSIAAQMLGVLTSIDDTLKRMLGAPRVGYRGAMLGAGRVA